MRPRTKTLGMLLVLLVGSHTLAHDTGFGHSRRTIFFSAAEGELNLEYRITQNADEALIEMTHLDADGDGRITAAERDRHFAEIGGKLAKRLQYRTVEGKPLQASFVRCNLGNSLTQSFHFTITTNAPEIILDDGNFPHKPGQVRIVGHGISIEPVTPVDLSHADWLSLKIVRRRQP